jgi:hypothetical protein
MCKIVRRIFSSLQNVNAIAVPSDAGIKAQYSGFERELRYLQIRTAQQCRRNNSVRELRY